MGLVQKLIRFNFGTVLAKGEMKLKIKKTVIIRILKWQQP